MVFNFSLDQSQTLIMRSPDVAIFIINDSNTDIDNNEKHTS